MAKSKIKQKNVTSRKKQMTKSLGHGARRGKQSNGKQSNSKQSNSKRNIDKLKMALTTQAKKRAEKLDKILLKLAPGPYTQILKQIQSGKRRINEERQLALQLGVRILEKAKEVRDSISLPRNRSTRG